VNNPFTFKKTKPTFSIGLNYKPNDDVLLFAKVSTAFLSGGAVGPFAFAPETVTAAEAGIKSDWFDNKLRFNATVWLAKYKHSQAASSGSVVGQPQLSVIVIDNGPLNAWGIELETVIKPVEGFTLTGTLGITPKHKLTNPNATFYPGQDYQHGSISKFVGSVAAQYETQPIFGDATIVFRLDANYQGKYRIIGDNNVDNPASATYIAAFAPLEFSPARWLVNGRVALRDIEVGGGNVEIGVWGRNLFNVDKPLFPFQFGTILFTNSYEPARTFGADVILKFGSHR